MEPKIVCPVPNLVIVDGFFEDPDAVRAFALQQTFVADDRYFKGKRTQQRFLFPGVKERFEGLLGASIKDWESYGTNGVFQSCVGGTTLVYHSDETSYAGVIYLNPNAPPQAGTTLVRSAATKGRTIGESAKLTGKSEEICLHEMYDGKLIDGTAWEPVDVAGNVYNRLVLWNGRLAHAATNYFGYDLATSRLFQIFFFNLA